MKSFRIIVIIIIINVLLLNTSCVNTIATSSGINSQGTQLNTGLTKEVEDLIFNKSDFSRLIKMEIPNKNGDGCVEIVKKIIANVDKYGYDLYGSECTSTNYELTQHKNLMEALTKYGYTSLVNAGKDKLGEEYFLFFYQQPIMKYLSYENASIMSSKTFLAMGSRKFKSINYKNEYREGSLKYIAVTFLYTIENIFPHYSEISDALKVDPRGYNLLPLNTTFEGQAKVYLNPDTGKWDLASFSCK